MSFTEGAPLAPGSLFQGVTDKAAVADLQRKLNAAGYSLAVDGQWGAKTQAAVLDAQRRLGVTPDGTMTPDLIGHLASLGQAGGTGSAPAAAPAPGTAGAAATPAAATLSPADLKQKVLTDFGPGMSALLSNTEVAPILLQAAKENRDATWVQMRLQGTAWYRNQSQTQLKWDELGRVQPAEQRRQITERTADVVRQAAQLGINLQGGIAEQVASDSLRNGWAPDHITEVISGYFGAGTDTHVGAIDGWMQQIKATAGLYGLRVGDTTDLAKRLAAGTATLDGVKAMYAQQAKARYPYMADLIDQGVTPHDYFAPYQQLIAQELEVAPDSVDLLNDPKWSPVSSTADGKGGTRVLTLSEAQRFVRSMPEWDKTQGAQQQAASLSNQILKTFGAVA